MSGNQLAMWIGCGVMFFLSLYLFWSADRMRDEAQEIRQKAYRDIKNQIDTSHSYLLDGIRGEVNRVNRVPKHIHTHKDSLVVPLAYVEQISHPDLKWGGDPMPQCEITFHLPAKEIVKLEKKLQRGWDK